MAEGTESKLARLIEEVNGAGRHNQWDVESLRECLQGFLDDLADEATRLPATLSKAHWDLFAIDGNRAEDVAFVVVVVSAERVAFVAGRGPWDAVREHGDNFLSEDAFSVLSETTRLFARTGTPVNLSREAFDDWLRRRP